MQETLGRLSAPTPSRRRLPSPTTKADATTMRHCVLYALSMKCHINYFRVNTAISAVLVQALSSQELYENQQNVLYAVRKLLELRKSLTT